ncbi:hypothetical protein N7527_011132 [Penicillium freii]|uniref:Uncharacterized protein n=1 Tax=Penicillium freii TaxID=48697 RepID=A0A101MR51_PENFR|nr:hypothetical protein N7527_011132 [Penicillium freii]KUM65185.1 hypothetical protein ACN42_g1930 [Penicillium freii]
MADAGQHQLWCKHCEVEGHLVTHCHVLYEDLTNFDAAVRTSQGPASDPKRAYPIARWGQGKKKKQVYGPGAFNAAGGVPVQGFNYPTVPPTDLNPLEAQDALNYLHQQWLYWLHCRAAWYENYSGENNTL